MAGRLPPDLGAGGGRPAARARPELRGGRRACHPARRALPGRLRGRLHPHRSTVRLAGLPRGRDVRLRGRHPGAGKPAAARGLRGDLRGCRPDPRPGRHPSDAGTDPGGRAARLGPARPGAGGHRLHPGRHRPRRPAGPDPDRPADAFPPLRGGPRRLRPRQ